MTLGGSNERSTTCMHVITAQWREGRCHPISWVVLSVHPLTWSRYAYVANNPLKYRDPAGLFEFPSGMAFDVGFL